MSVGDDDVTHGWTGKEATLEELHTLDLDGHGDPGKFGRMFPRLPGLTVSSDALEGIADAMLDDVPSSAAGDNKQIPAGYTYFGQFIDHDITRDVTPIELARADPLRLKNFRTPTLDLDSLYGGGPEVSPHLYARDRANFELRPEFLIGTASASRNIPTGQIPDLPNDIPRNSVGRALIGDERNDENLLVAQTHLLFLKFHNAIVAMLRRDGVAEKLLFEEAQRLTTWHYQWLVLYDFVDRLTEQGFVDRIRHQGRKFYRFKKRPYMPVEFSVAAFRLGHSMVRSEYHFNRIFEPEGLTKATLDHLFAFTGRSGRIVGELAPTGSTPPGPVAALPSNWVVDWRRFYDLGADGVTLNLSRRIDPFIAGPLHTLPEFSGRESKLPFRNLKRGVQQGLPSGQAIARAMRLPELAPEQVGVGSDGDVVQQVGLAEETPLWFYILKEAEQFHNGLRLGPVGSTIVAESMLGFVHGDEDSFLSQRQDWTPDLAVNGSFTMPDLIRFVDDLNPVG